jgi:trehalose/maltose transport system permease protein
MQNKRKIKAKFVFGKIGLWFMIALIAFYMLFPFYWTVVTSLKTEPQLQMMPTTLVPRDPVTKDISIYFGNYKNVLNNMTFIRGLFNSTVVAGGSTILCLLVGAFAGFAFGKLRFRGHKISMYVILAMTMFPSVSILSGLYAVMNAVNIPTMARLILSYMIFTLPFTTWVLAAFFKDLPKELMQSAQVDGATPVQTFWKILLPLTAPALVTTGLLAFINAWNEYLFALTFTTVDQSARTVPVAIALFSGTVARQQPFGEILAAATIVTIPIVVLVLIFQRRIISGLTSGAVKG